MSIHKPRREAAGDNQPWPHLDLALQPHKGETINVCFLSSLVCDSPFVTLQTDTDTKPFQYATVSPASQILPCRTKDASAGNCPSAAFARLAFGPTTLERVNPTAETQLGEDHPPHSVPSQAEHPPADPQDMEKI